MSAATVGPPKADHLITASIFAASTAILFLSIINDDWHDAYIHFRAGERIARGEVPYRDFFMFWFPGAPLALAAWFKLFGTGLFGLQLLQALLAGATVTIGWLIARLSIPSPFSMAVPFVLAGVYVVGNQGMNHMSFSSPLALLAIWAALKALPASAPGFCFLAGASAAAAGMCTITTGAWLGVALIAGAMFFPVRRIRSAAYVAAGGASVLALLLIYLFSLGMLGEFVDSAIIWPRERYAPFHAGVGWGAWLPSWEMLNSIPAVWKASWFLTLCLLWAQTYVLPCVLIASLVLAAADRKRPERVILLLAAGALMASAFPNAAVMRLARLSAPLWILIVFECAALLSVRPKWMSLAFSATSIAAFLLLIPLQWSYHDSFIKVETLRGAARLQQVSAFEYHALQKNIPAESRVAVMPEYRAAAWLLKFDNPTSFDTLTPILYSPHQLKTAAAQLREAGYPLVVRFASSELSNLESIETLFKPSKYVNEWQNNELNDLLARYTTYQAGSLQILKYQADK